MPLKKLAISCGDNIPGQLLETGVCHYRPLTVSHCHRGATIGAYLVKEEGGRRKKGGGGRGEVGG